MEGGEARSLGGAEGCQKTRSPQESCLSLELGPWCYSTITTDYPQFENFIFLFIMYVSQKLINSFWV
jgi:hypothetical protein